jgi:hypothetical protein
MVEHLPKKYQALSSSTTKYINKKKVASVFLSLKKPVLLTLIFLYPYDSCPASSQILRKRVHMESLVSTWHRISEHRLEGIQPGSLEPSSTSPHFLHL